MKIARLNRPLTRFAAASLVLEVVLSIGALGGGLVLIVAPRGEIMPLPLSALAGSPFETGIGWVPETSRRQVAAILGLTGQAYVRTLISLGHPTEAARQPKSAPGTARRPLAEVVRDP